jgi:2-(1,2-epoxy-1,2-dihydrophenyl)acetyl-CoA isomerase
MILPTNTNIGTHDIAATTDDDFVATVELRRPPNNFFDLELIRSLADVYEHLAADPRCRAIVLAGAGKHFSAGVDFSRHREGPEEPDRSQGNRLSSLYREAMRLFTADLPVVAAVHGAAIGGGLGLACSADFRIACAESRFSANFAQLGFHHGFGLTVTLPPIVGQQRGLELLYTGRRIGGEEASRIGLCDRLVDAEHVRPSAHDLAAEVARSAPLAVTEIRRTMRAELIARLPAAVELEAAQQLKLRRTADWAEGIRASAERRQPLFQGT